MPEGRTARHGNIRGETKSGVKWALAAPSPTCILAPLTAFLRDQDATIAPAEHV